MSQTTEQVIQLLSTHPIFSLLEVGQSQFLAESAAQTSFAMGQEILRQDDPGDCAWLVLEGKARVVFREPNGQRITLNQLTRGDLFGEQSLLNDQPRNATVRASTEVLALRIDYEMLNALFEQSPALRDIFEQILSDRTLQNFLKASSLLGRVPARHLRHLVDILETRAVLENTAVDLNDENNAGLYIVQEGRFIVESTATDSRQIRVAGELFGYRSLLEESRQSDQQVVCKESGKLLLLSKSRFDQLADSHSELYQLLSDFLATQSAAGVSETPPASVAAPAVPGADDQAAQATLAVKRKSFRRHPFVPQLDEADCGPACMAMIGTYYGVRYTINRLREVLRVGKEGASMFNMSRGAEQLGYRSRAIKVDYQRLQEIPLPAVAFWKGYHYIVVYEANNKRVIIGDPASGIERIKRADFEQNWSGHLLEVVPGEELESEEPKQGRWSRFWPLVKPHRTMLVEIFIASLLLNIFALAMPIFTQTVVDKVLIDRNIGLLNIMLTGMVLIGVFQVITALLRYRLLLHVSTQVRRAMSAQLFNRILRLGMRYFDTRRIGDILTRFGDNEKIQQLLTGTVVTTLLDGIMIFVYLGLMLLYSPTLTGVALVFIPLLILIAVGFTSVLRRHNERYFERTAIEQSRLIESIRDITAVKSNSAEVPLRWRYEEAMGDSMVSYFQGARASMLMHTLSRLVQIASATLLLWYGARLVLAGEMTVGQLMAFQALVAMVMAPIMGFIGLWQQLQDALLSLQRLSDIYEADLEQENSASRVQVELRGHLKLENLSFHYNDGDKDILRNIQLEIPAGEHLAIVGRSGSGKSTLAMLLQGFYAPTSGRILVDGHDLRNIDLNNFRHQIGVVPQDAAIFNGTIRENMAMYRDDIELDQIAQAAQLANAHDLIMGFPLGYETMIGEMGVKLSGGQKQRLCIARAIMHDPKILILDEATSAMDAESEKAIQDNLTQILQNRTALIIAHRFNTLRNCDRILVLDEGMVAELGTHSELMLRKGLYYYLYSQQMNL